MYFGIINPDMLNLFNITAVVVSVALAYVMFVYLTAEPYAQLDRSIEECYFTDEISVKRSFPSIADPWSTHLSVVVPAYNEENRLKPMLDECLSFLEERKKCHPKYQYEVIIVNDGSRDETPGVAAEYTKKYGSAKVRVLNLDRNRGKGGAVALGVCSSRGAVVLFADADGATKFADVQKLEVELKRLTGVDYISDPDDLRNSLAVVCGSRAHLEETAVASRSYFRTVLMYGFHFLVRAFSGTTLKDTQCGFKMFTRGAAARCFTNMHVKGWAFDVELLYIAKRFGIPVAEVGVNWQEIGGSKIVPIFSWLRMAGELFKIWLFYNMAAWDIHADYSEEG